MVVMRIANKLKCDLPRIGSAYSQRLSWLLRKEARKVDLPVNPPPLTPNTFLFIPETRFHLLSPLKSPQPGPLGGKWLARMSPLWHNNVNLYNPLNVHEYLYSDPPLEGFIDLLDTHVLELSRVFFLLEDKDGEVKPISKKVVGGWNIHSDYLFGVLALLERERGGGLWLWRFKDDEWVEIEGTSLNGDHSIVDIAYHDEKFYAFERWTWRIGVIDPRRDPVTMEFIAAPNIKTNSHGEGYILTIDGRLHFIWGAYFVTSNGQLYLVIEVSPKSQGDGGKSEVKKTLIVYVLKQQCEGGEEEEEGGQREMWERVKNIGDQIFFIGYDASFALPSSSVNLPQWKPSSICLFTTPFFLIYDGFLRAPKGVECLKRLDYATYWRYYRLFEMGADEEKEEENSIVHFEKLPMDVYTGLFFPPPPWVQFRCPDVDNAEVSFENVKFSGW